MGIGSLTKTRKTRSAYAYRDPRTGKRVKVAAGSQRYRVGSSRPVSHPRPKVTIKKHISREAQDLAEDLRGFAGRGLSFAGRQASRGAQHVAVAIGRRWRKSGARTWLGAQADGARNRWHQTALYKGMNDRYTRFRAWHDAFRLKVAVSEGRLTPEQAAAGFGGPTGQMPAAPRGKPRTPSATRAHSAQMDSLTPHLKAALDRDDAEVTSSVAAFHQAQRRHRAQRLVFDRTGVRPVVKDPTSGETLAFEVHRDTPIGDTIAYFGPDNSQVIRPAVDDALRERLGLRQLDGTDDRVPRAA